MPAVKPTKSHLVAPALLFQPKPSFRLVEPKSQRSKFMFSDLALRKLKRPPKGQQVTYHDSVQRGLSLLVISTGAKTFRSRYTYGEDANGKPLHRTRSIGRFGENTLENGLDVSVRAARRSSDRIEPLLPWASIQSGEP